MCMGESADDTLQQSEQEAIALAAGDDLPGHRVAIRGNDDGMAWVVLEPLADDHQTFRFTICRIAPCLVVMVEGREGRRFLSAGTIAEAMDAVRSVDLERRFAVSPSAPHRLH